MYSSWRSRRRHLANAIKRSVLGGDAGFCYQHCSNLFHERKVKYELLRGSGGYPKKAGAVMRVRTISGRNASHQAPTQRGSFCCNVILQRKRATHLIYKQGNRRQQTSPPVCNSLAVYIVGQNLVVISALRSSKLAAATRLPSVRSIAT